MNTNLLITIIAVIFAAVIVLYIMFKKIRQYLKMKKILNNTNSSNQSNVNIYSIVIGVENSKVFGNCAGCELDSNRIRDVVTPISNCGITFLQNSNATKENVLTAFKTAVSKNPDLVVFYYSGHGGQATFADTNCELEPDNKDEFLCLYDTYLKDDDIWNNLVTKVRRIHLIFDCCHSETMFRTPSISFDPSMFLSRSSLDSGLVLSSRSGEKQNNINMLCWSGCPDESYSYGSNIGGVMTNALLANLLHLSNNTSNITSESIKTRNSYSYIWNKIESDPAVKRQSARQTIIGWDNIDLKSTQIFK